MASFFTSRTGAVVNRGTSQHTKAVTPFRLRLLPLLECPHQYHPPLPDQGRMWPIIPLTTSLIALGPGVLVLVGGIPHNPFGVPEPALHRLFPTLASSLSRNHLRYPCYDHEEMRNSTLAGHVAAVLLLRRY